MSSSLSAVRAANGDLFNVDWATTQAKSVLTLCVVVVGIVMFRYVIKGKISALLTIVVSLVLVGFVVKGNPLDWGAAVAGNLFGAK